MTRRASPRTASLDDCRAAPSDGRRAPALARRGSRRVAVPRGRSSAVVAAMAVASTAHLLSSRLRHRGPRRYGWSFVPRRAARLSSQAAVAHRSERAGATRRRRLERRSDRRAAEAQPLRGMFAVLARNYDGRAHSRRCRAQPARSSRAQLDVCVPRGAGGSPDLSWVVPLAQVVAGQA